MTDLLSAIRWWAALTLLGLVALPLVYTLLRPLADRGYAFIKTAGLALAVALAVLLTGWTGVLMAAAALGVGVALSASALRRIGGQTGDVLGASQQLAEAACLAVLSARV